MFWQNNGNAQISNVSDVKTAAKIYKFIRIFNPHKKLIEQFFYD